MSANSDVLDVLSRIFAVNRGEDSPLKATDFGLSVFIEEGKVYRDIVGSAYYVAPEVLGQNYGKDIDVWSAEAPLRQVFVNKYRHSVVETQTQQPDESSAWKFSNQYELTSADTTTRGYQC
ncbi:hypothetical protein IFM89_021445 [Coptis chinensis]|uniref:Protein kinase domain-containing protein n=1 Tax=Coptis chinensis TaxID=261450 RepID=A0A835IWX9_9MAGN|nr:hypothetical protein IFM89_021445 [Coptis chinensis]